MLKGEADRCYKWSIQELDKWSQRSESAQEHVVEPWPCGETGLKHLTDQVLLKLQVFDSFLISWKPARHAFQSCSSNAAHPPDGWRLYKVVETAEFIHHVLTNSLSLGLLRSVEPVPEPQLVWA